MTRVGSPIKFKKLALYSFMIEAISQFHEDPKGYDTALDMEMFNRRLILGHDPLLEIRDNVRLWLREYPLGGEIPVFENPVELDSEGFLVNSQTKIRLINLTNQHERQGQVWRSVLEMGRVLKRAKKGDFVFAVSPGGHSEDSQGRRVDYKQDYFVGFQKGEGDTIDRALILGFDNEFTENIRFLRSFGIDPGQGETLYDIRCNVTGTVVHLVATAEKKWDFVDFVTRYDEIRRDSAHPLSDALRAKLVEGIQNSARITAMRDRADRISALYWGEFEQFVLERRENWDDPVVQEEIRQAERSMLWKISYELVQKDEVPQAARQSLTASQQALARAFLSSLNGCNDRGFEKGHLMLVGGPFGERVASTENRYHKGRCVKCLKTDVWVGACKWCLECEKKTGEFAAA